jgi:uncharacterized protein YndB with AHSA1/START domain
MKNVKLPQLPDRTILSSRTFDTDIQTLYHAWTNPGILAKWWGPTGFTNTFHEYNLRPGGHWKFVMHAPDKGNYNNECVFLDIDAPYRLLWNHVSPPEFQVEASFTEEKDGRATVVFKMVFETPEAYNKLIDFVPEKNEENFNRLEAELLKLNKQNSL